MDGGIAAVHRLERLGVPGLLARVTGVMARNGAHGDGGEQAEDKQPAQPSAARGAPLEAGAMALVRAHVSEHLVLLSHY